ncbi:MAG: hypothetical protein ACK40M_10660 [Flavobacteriales bacterium]
MNDIERLKKYKLQTNKLYSAYGKFAVEFEQMCESIRHCLIFTLHSSGLKEQKFARILLADQTASPLISKLTAFVAEVYSKEPDKVKYLQPLFKFCIDINEKRNEIIHGTWYIGWASAEQTDFSRANGAKDKITKKGIRNDGLDFSVAEFHELSEKIIKANEMIRRLSVCITRGADLKKNVVIEKLK